MCMSNINIYKKNTCYFTEKKITCYILDIQKLIQIKPHIFGSDQFGFF